VRAAEAVATPHRTDLARAAPQTTSTLIAVVAGMIEEGRRTARLRRCQASMKARLPKKH
jgi:hypothetical protein